MSNESGELMIYPSKLILFVIFRYFRKRSNIKQQDPYNNN